MKYTRKYGQFFAIIGIILFVYLVYEQLPKKFQDVDTESSCSFVSSRGILYSCDIHPKNPKSSVTSVYDIDLTKVQRGQTVYIQGSAVKQIYRQLDKIPNPFILVTGDCDESIPDAVLSDTEFKKFIESDKIIHWFSQNAVGKHPKFSPIPIGLDYHTRINSDKWGPKMSPLNQESEILSVKAAAKPFYERTLKAHANFHFNMTGGKFTDDRKKAKEQISPECVFYEPKLTKTRLETLKNQSQYAFVVSPHGNGLDCHRTWEALVLGCIPIVKTSPLDSLFEDLPVWIVREWSDVTEENMRDIIEKYRRAQFNYDKLQLAYWMRRIRELQ
jgi:hypothetical protein